MRPVISIPCILMALGAVASRAGAQRSVITHVNVVDVASGRIDRDRDIVIDGEIIVDVTPASANPAGAAHDFAGGYVIPGLWDMNAHLSRISRSTLAALLASGVVGLRHDSVSR